MALSLGEGDRSMLRGGRGQGLAMAMRVVTRVAEAMGATELLDITGAHIDSCLYHGPSGIDFVERLVAGGASVAVPSTLNVSSLDLMTPDRFQGSDDFARNARRLMDGYVNLGCSPTWTCAPYHEGRRPGFGDHVAWAESNAIVFANAVLGARTHRYGDFIDICAALTGRAPAAGLHLDENRRGRVVYELGPLRPELLQSDALAPVLGYLVGADCAGSVPVIIGLAPGQPEHRLKAFGAATASSGGIGMFHAVGSTPEAPTLHDALHGQEPERRVVVDAAALRAVRDRLSPAADTKIGAVCLGTPHYGIAEFERLRGLLDGRRAADTVALYVNTSRAVWNEVQLRGWASSLLEAGVRVVQDTCTYITPVMEPFTGLALTDSAKWAHYAPGNVGVDAAFAPIEDCVESAVAGRLVNRTSAWWHAP